MFFYLILILFLFAVLYYFFFSNKSQLWGQVIYAKKNTKEKLVALTFDDGPNGEYTKELLKVLNKHNVKATFFVVGQNAQRYPEIVQQAFNEGHIIANHSVHHSFWAPFFHLKFENELKTNQKILTDIIGKTPALFRPPWFHRNWFMLQTTKKMGLTTILGTFASFWEVFQINASSIAQDAIKNAKKATKNQEASFLVFHDGYNNKSATKDIKAKRNKTIKAVDITIQELIKEGYQFKLVSELLDIKPYQDSNSSSFLGKEF